MSAHAFLAPSGAFAWKDCSGMPRLRASVAHLIEAFEKESPAALEGSAAHWGAKEMIYGRPIALGQVADNNVTLDEEMIAGVEQYVDVIRQDLAKDPMHVMYCEQPISIATIHEANWGTPDFWAYRPGLLRVYDFKYGYQFVEVFENWQLIDYVAGILAMLGLNGHDEQVTRIEMVIVQPRSFHPDGQVRRWPVMASDLRAHFNILRTAANYAMSENPIVKTGPQCEYCDAQRWCKALQADAMRSVDMSSHAVPFGLDAIQVGHELRAIERAEDILAARKRGLTEQVDQLLRRGEVVPFYQMGSGRGATVWTKSPAEIIMLGQMMGVNFKKPDAVITPLQAKELPTNPSMIDAVSEHRPGARKVIRINPLSVRKAFSK